MIELKHVVLLLVGGSVALFLTRRHYAKARALLQAWAEGNGYKILHVRQCSFFMPLGMLLSSSNCQIVYRVRLYDPSMQRVRSAWVRLGTYWSGALDADAVDVRWLR